MYHALKNELMALVCGNCGGDLALSMSKEISYGNLAFTNGSAVECVSCGYAGVIAAADRAKPPHY